MAKNCDMCSACEYQYAIYVELVNGLKLKVLLPEESYWTLYDYSISLGSMHTGLVTMLKNVELVPDERKVLKLE